MISEGVYLTLFVPCTDPCFKRCKGGIQILYKTCYKIISMVIVMIFLQATGMVQQFSKHSKYFKFWMFVLHFKNQPQILPVDNQGTQGWYDG